MKASDQLHALAVHPRGAEDNHCLTNTTTAGHSRIYNAKQWLDGTSKINRDILCS